jgi:hypothetical protein
MTDAQMRALVASLYSGRKWKDKVARMDSQQVFAIYQDALRRGRFDKKPAANPPAERKFEPYSGVQLSLFD